MKGRKLLKVEQISDFRVGIDRIIRKGNRAFVIDTEGIRKEVEVQPDTLTPDFEQNIRKLSSTQKAMMIECIRTTPYLTREGRAERLVILNKIRGNNMKRMDARDREQLVRAKEAAKMRAQARARYDMIQRVTGNCGECDEIALLDFGLCDKCKDK